VNPRTIVTVLTLYVATAGNLGLEQAGPANRSILDAIVFYADPPSDVAQFPRDVREDLERYRQRLRDYRPRPRPSQLGSEMTMVYAAREGYERKLVAASTKSGVEEQAQKYVDDLRPCYEWEGFHDCPEREAVFAQRYLIDHPDTAFAAFLRVLAAHRWLCAAEAYEYEQQPGSAAHARHEYQRALAIAVKAESPLMRVAADELKSSGRCHQSDPFVRKVAGVAGSPPSPRLRRTYFACSESEGWCRRSESNRHGE